MPTTVFRNEVVRLADLFAIEQVLDDYRFEDCFLVGPCIVLFPGDGVEIAGSTFTSTVPEMFWIVEPGRDIVVGCLAFTSSAFINCHFEKVGIAGSETLRAALLGGTTS